MSLTTPSGVTNTQTTSTSSLNNLVLPGKEGTSPDLDKLVGGLLDALKDRSKFFQLLDAVVKALDNGGLDLGSGTTPSPTTLPGGTTSPVSQPERAEGNLKWDEKAGVYYWTGATLPNNFQTGVVAGTSSWRGPSGEQLVAASGGNGKLFRVNGAPDDILYYFAPNAENKWEWNRISTSEYKAGGLDGKTYAIPGGQYQDASGKWQTAPAAENQFVDVLKWSEPLPPKTGPVYTYGDPQFGN